MPTGNDPHHSGDYPLDKSVDELCCDLLDELFPRAGGTVWKAPIILKFKVQFRIPTINGLEYF